MSIQDTIKEQVTQNDVVLFMKGNPAMPMCGFSAKAVQILKQFNVPFASVDVLQSDEIRQGIKIYSNWPTIPQLYVKGEFIGGSDIMTEMNETGELQSLLENVLIK